MAEKTSTLRIVKFRVPLFLLLVCILAYGLLIPTLGYYWDDWPYAWINHMFGPAGYPEFVALDRPYSAWIFMGLTWLYGEQPLSYHLNSLVLYWLCSTLFWWLIRVLWPDQPREALWAALIFAVYPGFLGHPNAIIYNHHYTAMALYLLSFIGTLKAVKSSQEGRIFSKTWLWHLPAMLAMLLSQFSIEYYLGWEVVRPLLIWFALQKQRLEPKQRLVQVVVHGFPYWLGTLGFFIWRVFIFEFPTYQPIDVGAQTLFSKTWFRTILSQIVDVVLLVWRRALPRLSSGTYSQEFWFFYLGLTALAILMTYLFLYYFRPSKKRHAESPQGSSSRPIQGFWLPALIIALPGIFFAGLPFWLTELIVRIEGPFFSRFTLAFIPWVALLMTALFHLMSFVRVRLIQVLRLALIASMVGGSIGWHVWNANLYRNDWLEVQRYFNQMVRRIPDLEPGTTLLINDMPFLNLYSDNSLTAILNWTYAPDTTSKDMDYMVYYLSVRLGLGLIALERGLPIEQPYRSLNFSSTTDKVLVVYKKPPGCLRVLDNIHPERIPESFPEEMLAALPISNLSLIKTESDVQANPPEGLFEPVQQPNWCLYFEEAELAGQRGDWNRVVELGDQAFSLRDQSNDETELFIFLEGYLQAGDLESALEVSEYLRIRAQWQSDQAICRLWQRVESETPGGFDPNFDLEGVYNDFCY